MYDYDRMGGMRQAEFADADHKKHVGAATLLLLGGAVWLGFYSHWLKQLNDANPNKLALSNGWCCVFTDLKTGDQYGPYECSDYTLDNTYEKTNVSAQFHHINAIGVSLMVIMIVVALGHCVKPLRCFTKIFGGLVWVAYVCFFIAANVFRFRDTGRICSLDSGYPTQNCALNYGPEICQQWTDQGLF